MKTSSIVSQLEIVVLGILIKDDEHIFCH